MSTFLSRSNSPANLFEAIRRGIEDGDFVPGQRLVEADLCEFLSASHREVRSALMALSHEKIVEYVPRRGARVRVVSLEEALNTTEVRMVIESLCAARAAERITDAEIESLRTIGAEMKQRAEEGDTMGYSDLVHRLFMTYVRIADQPVAAEILIRLRDRNSRHRFRLRYRTDRARVSLPYWLAIIDAICNRDPDAARLAVERHNRNAQETIKALAERDSLIGPTVESLSKSTKKESRPAKITNRKRL